MLTCDVGVSRSLTPVAVGHRPPTPVESTSTFVRRREMKVEKTKEDHSGGQPAGGTAFMAGYGYDPTGY
eukprot:scaffold180128_cov35-Tisochrysis_lutea.AAC.1